MKLHFYLLMALFVVLVSPQALSLATLNEWEAGDGNLFMAMRDESNLWTYDGINKNMWAGENEMSLVHSSQLVKDICVYKGNLVAVHGETYGEVFTSTDGNTWTKIGDDGDGDFRESNLTSCAVYDGNLFVSLYEADHGAVYTYDGTNWNVMGDGNHVLRKTLSLYADTNNLYAAGTVPAGNEATFSYWDGSQWFPVEQDIGASNEATQVVTYDANGSLFVGLTGNARIYYFTDANFYKTGTYDIVDINGGSDMVGLVECDGNLWAATNTGLFTFESGSDWNAVGVTGLHYDYKLYSVGCMDDEVYVGMGAGAASGDAELWKYDGSYGNFTKIFDNDANFGGDSARISGLYGLRYRLVDPRLNLSFADENTFAPLNNINVTFNGQTYDVNADSTFTVNLLGLTDGTYVVQAVEDSNYPVRYFEFDVNQSALIDQNLAMLRDTNGVDINFLFRDTDQTTILSNAKITALRDNNIASIRTTDSLGQTSMFLEADANYVFIIERSNGTSVTYYPTILTINIPKDEVALSNISPFDITASVLATGQFLNQSASLDRIVLSNTTNFYVFDVNAGINYFSRKYYLNYKGNPATATLQPYLVKVVDGIDVVFSLRNSLDFTSEPDILMRSFKNIPTLGRTEVEVVRADDAGLANLSFIQDSEYELEFYDVDGNFLFSKSIVVNFAQYFVYLDTGEIVLSETTLESIGVSGLPKQGYVVFGSTGFDLNVVISVIDGNVSLSWFTVSNADGNLEFNSNCGTSCGIHITAADLNTSGTISATVFVQTVSGLVFKKSWNFTPVHEDQFNMIETLKSAAFRKSMGCSTDVNEPCFILVMIAAFITLGMLFVAGATTTTDRGALSIIAIISLSIFTYLTWIPVGFFVLAALAGFASIVVTRRFG